MYNLKEIYENPAEFKELLEIPGYLIYRIYNDITKKSYIGDTEVNLSNRLFTGWNGGHFGCYNLGIQAHLYNSMRKYGLEHFWIELLKASEELTEEYYIEFYDSYRNGYNQNKTGKGLGNCNEGFIWINNGISSKLIDPELLSRYEEQGWTQGRLTPWLEGLVWMHNEEGLIRIDESEISFYESQGYELGTGIASETSSGLMWMNDGTSEYLVDPDDIPDDLVKGRLNVSTQGLFGVTDGKVTKFVTQEMFDKMPSNWVRGTTGHSTLGRVWVNDGERSYTIDPSELQEHLDSGYFKGRLTSKTKDKLWVVNFESESKIIDKSQYEEYKALNYRLGKFWDKSWEM